MPIDGILKKYLTLTALQALFRFAATRYMYNWVTSLVAYIIRITLEFVQNSVMGKQMTSKENHQSHPTIKTKKIKKIRR